MPMASRIVADDEKPMAAIIIINKSLRAVKIAQMCDTHHNCVEIISPNGKFILLNMYSQFKDDLNLDVAREVCETYSYSPVS